MDRNALNRKNQSMDHLDKKDKNDFKYKILNDDGEISYTNKLGRRRFQTVIDE